MKRFLLLVLLLGCGPGDSPPPGNVRAFTDDGGRVVDVHWPPKRIVSILPSATELLFAVGAGDQVVGVTQYCVYPEAAREKPKIGSIIHDMERIAALNPDVLVTTWRMTAQTATDLEAAGYAVYSVDPKSFEEIASALRKIGTLTNHEEEGRLAAEALLERVRKVVPVKNGPTVYFESSPEPLWAAGLETHPGDVIRLAGGRNIFPAGWRQVDWEEVLAKDPDVILIAHEDRRGVEQRAGWNELGAVKSGRVHFVPREHFIYATPRLAIGLEKAARIFNAKNP